MTGRIIRKLGSLVYDYPKVSEDVERGGRFGRLKIALVTDYFTTDCLSAECRVRTMTPATYRDVIENWKPDLIFVESTFHGVNGSWRYELAKQPKLLRLSKPKAIFRLVDCAKRAGIPTVFWNKDDGAFFDTFIDVAKAFDYVFTTDEECIDRYRQHLPAHVPVSTLVMPYQPAFHNFSGFNFTRNEACFMGSYYRRILSERRRFLDMMFDICEHSNMRLNIFDRNHDRLSRLIGFRFPKKSQLHLHGKVSHRETADIYKSHVASINVNSVPHSGTMFSRRLLEILACGGIAITNSSRAVDRYFRDFCHVVTTPGEAEALFARLHHGPSREDMDRAEAGAIHVRQHHTWAHRLDQICATVKL
jgi:spore maturation protein CgeB